MELQEKLETLAKKMEEQQIQRLRDRGMSCEANIMNSRTRVVPGRKYTKIDVGTSGRLMIDNNTQEIFGIKAYGVIHKGHRYGTLDTIEDFFWGEYYPMRIKK